MEQRVERPLSRVLSRRSSSSAIRRRSSSRRKASSGLPVAPGPVPRIAVQAFPIREPNCARNLACQRSDVRRETPSQRGPARVTRSGTSMARIWPVRRPNDVRRVSVACLLAALAACGGSGRDRVQVRGTLATSGGPVGAVQRIPGASLRLVPVSDSGTAASAKTDGDGRFFLTAEPGRYRVVITGHAPMVDGRFIPPIPRTFVVVAGKRMRVRLLVPIR